MRASHRLSSVRLLGLVALAISASACSGSESFTGQCTTSDDCPVGAYCRSDGLCACRTDEACQEGEFCNRQGVCQARTDCRSNVDCTETDFCDLSSGDCIPRTSCATDVHCIHGTVCQRGGSACVNGCYDDADCPLYSVCERTGTSTSALGHCIANKCSDKTFCDYGSRCTGETCSPDPNPNHCAACNNQPGDCGSASNFCLINSSYDPANPATGSPYFCGVECDAQEDCPNGYGCGGVILLTQDQCTDTSQCSGGGRECIIGEGEPRGYCTCASDADCAFDSAPPACIGSCGGFGITMCTSDNDCLASPCVRQCQWPQGQACTSDAQCQPLPICAPLGGQMICVTDGFTPCSRAEDCLCSAGSCINTGRPCTTGAQCQLSCQGGGCLLGAACAPNQGLLCPDVR
ncbi:MAG: hypothetical protein IT384_19650 [Deltaproteobacteria bacterium]|nr:hypothetical protein [Deltaproteobacteria bacterium]